MQLGLQIPRTELGFQTAIGSVPRVETLTPLERIGRDVMPRIASLPPALSQKRVATVS